METNDTVNNIPTAKIGNIVEWESRNGQILQGKVLNVHDRIVAVDCTIMSDFKALRIEDRQTVKHTDYKIIDHQTSSHIKVYQAKPEDNSLVQKNGFTLGEVMKVKDTSNKNESKKNTNTELTSAAITSNERPKEVPVPKEQALFIRFGHTKEEYLELAEIKTDKEIRDLWKWDHNKINRFKNEHKLIGVIPRKAYGKTNTQKPVLTAEDLNKKYDHTKEEYLTLSLTHKDREITELWNWDHNKMYRFKKAHDLTGTRGRPKLTSSKTTAAEVAEPVVAETAVGEVAEPVRPKLPPSETTVAEVAELVVAETAVEEIAEPVVAETAVGEVAEPVVAETAVEEVAEPVVAETAVGEVAEPVVAEMTVAEVAEPVVAETTAAEVAETVPTQSLLLFEEENSDISNQWSHVLETKNNEIQHLQEKVEQLQTQQSEQAAFAVAPVYQEVVTAFVQLETALQNVANQSILGNILLNAIASKTTLNSPTK